MGPKKRRRRFQSGKPMEVGSNEFLVDSRTKSCDIEHLAHKYMQKCTVDSSTESESDANPEVLSDSMHPEGFLEKTSYSELQFLDPYDGDYEELSGDSDCNLGSCNSSPSRAFLMKHLTTESKTTEASTPSERLGPSSASLFKRIFETGGQEEEEPVLHKTARILQLTAEPSRCLGAYVPSKHNGISENAFSDSALQPVLMECDNELCNELHVTRKQRRPALECTGEKIRKRLRVA